jgi:glycosyl hydrolase family 12
MGARVPRSRKMLIIGAALTASIPVLIALAPSASAAPTTLCGRDQHMTVHTSWGLLLTLRNDNWLSPGCVLNWGARPNFQVTTAYAADPTGRKVVAFPDVFRGCSWGVCSPRPGLPQEVSKLGRPRATWRTVQRAGGRWNAAFDIWFSKHSMTNGQAEGAELMIWLKTQDLPPATAWPKVWIGHHRYYLEHWVAMRGSATWNYIQFRRVHPVRGVRRLSIRRFIHRAERLGWIKPWWWMDNIEAGFEIWWGGKGLATTRFSATP